MAYFDMPDIVDAPGAEEERRRQMLASLVGRRGSVLGMRDANQPPPALATPSNPRGTDLATSSTLPANLPNRMPPTGISTQPPDVGSPSFSPSAGPLGGGAIRPTRPDVMPTRADFPAKPELGGWKKALGLGAGFALGSAPLVNFTLHGQQNAAEGQYQKAAKEWEQEQGDRYRAAQTENLLSEAQARRTPKPEKPESLDQVEADFYSSEVAKGKDPMQVLGSIYTARQQGKTPSGNEEEQAYQQEVKKNPNLTRLQFHKQWAQESKQQTEPGSFIPTYDPKTGQLTGAWDPKSGRTVGAPGGGGTTSQGLAATDKRQQELQKQLQPYQAVIDESNQAQQLKDAADKGNAEADVGLALTFFKAMRSGTTGGSGIRFTQQENNLIMGARSLWDAMEVRGNKIFANGQPLSKQQRQSILDVINIYRNAAQRRVSELQGGQGQAQTTAQPGNIPTFSQWKAGQNP